MARVGPQRHRKQNKTVIIAPIPSNLSSYWWNHLINPVELTIAAIASVNGHGLLFTIWNGLFSCIDIN